MNNLNLVKILCYSGIIPFYFLSLLSFFFKDFFISELFSIYSLIILSFLFGSTWLHLIIYETKNKITFFIIFTVLMPVFLILVEILLPSKIKFFLYAISFFIIYMIDQKFIKNPDYLKIRKNLTTQVIIAHTLFLISIYSNSFWNIFKTIFF